MNDLRKIVLVAGIVFSVPLAAAQTNNKSAGVAASWLTISNNARAAGMAEAFSAVADDVNTLSVNPAGLAGLK